MEFVLMFITVAAFVIGVPAGLITWWLIATIATQRKTAREIRGFEVQVIEKRAG